MLFQSGTQGREGITLCPHRAHAAGGLRKCRQSIATRTQPTSGTCGSRHAARGWLAVAWAIWPGVWCSRSRPECEPGIRTAATKRSTTTGDAESHHGYDLMHSGPGLSTGHRNLSQRRFIRCLAQHGHIGQSCPCNEHAMDSGRGPDAFDRCCADHRGARRIDLSSPATRAPSQHLVQMSSTLLWGCRPRTGGTAVP
jgi:hypothetical protein